MDGFLQNFETTFSYDFRRSNVGKGGFIKKKGKSRFLSVTSIEFQLFLYLKTWLLRWIWTQTH